VLDYKAFLLGSWSSLRLGFEEEERLLIGSDTSSLWLDWQIQLTQSQIQAITMQMQGKQPGQSIVIRTTQLDQQQQQDDTDTAVTTDFSPQVYMLPVVVVVLVVAAG